MSENTKKNTKETTKKEVVKKEVFDFKGYAESIEAAFKDYKDADIIADSNLKEGPKNTTIADYRYIHFYNPGTQKDIFGMYIVGKGRIRFALNLQVEEYLDSKLEKKDVEKKVKGEKRKVAVDVYCDQKDAVVVAKSILTAYQQIKPTEKQKPEKKAPAKTEKKPAEKKAPVAKKQTTAKKAANK